MNINITNNNDTNRTTKTGMSLPGFLGNEGKCKEVSRVFASILSRGCCQGDGVQGTVQAGGLLNSIEQLAKESGIRFEDFNDIATRKGRPSQLAYKADASGITPP